MPSVTVPTLIKNALVKINVADPTETLDAEDSAEALSILNRLIDGWNAERQTVFQMEHKEYTLTADLDPHTIGSNSATFSRDPRPVSIEGANLILNNVTPNIYIPLNMRDEDWWLSQSVKALDSDVPTDLYYEPSWPNGKLHLWPTPETAYGLELLTRVLLTGALTTSSSIDLPPGYEDAITNTLAERCGPSFHAPVSAELKLEARQARRRVFVNNQKAPNISTADYGLPGRRGAFNYLTGGLS